MSDPILELRNLKMYFPLKGGVFSRQIAAVKAVDGVSLTIARGETLGLVGESGCGKSTLGKSIVRLTKPTAGSVIFEGDDTSHFSQRKLRPLRCNMQMVFQDPFASLNPQMTLADQVAEPLKNYNMAQGSELMDRVARLFDRVELPRAFMRRFPHELSGGQRQRIAIARALILEPEFLVLDEPTSALDRSVQAQIIDMLRRLQKQKGLTYLFISHDLKVVRTLSHQVMVMQNGVCVETGTASQIFDAPREAYTKNLLAAALDTNV